METAAGAGPGWPELPMDMLLEILRCAAVCTAWRTAYRDLRRRGIAASRQTPCLIYRSAAAGLNAIGMYSLSDQRPYTIPIPDPISEQHWFGSSHGWLIAADCRSDIILLNPITGRRIALPPATTMQHVTLVLNEEGILDKDPSKEHSEPDTYSLEEYRRYMYTKLVLSSNPSSDDDCIPMLIHQPYDQLSFAKVGGNSWNWLAVIPSLTVSTMTDGSTR
uniref:KIB1-4 beta-propeller domain-containing protein n=1 Tax=Oryza meridionalis TaxID=40149 RepID=A0A0E0E2P2_9ORYZ